MKIYYVLGLMLLTSCGILAFAATADKHKEQMPEKKAASTLQHSVAASTLAGKKLFLQKNCGSCHSDADPSKEFDPMMPAPKIAGQSKYYLIKILADFRDGKLKGTVMPSMTKSLKDDEIAHLAEWLSGLPKPGLKKSGQNRPAILNGDKTRLIQACESCHGLNGKGTASAPFIAGQNRDYFDNQFKAFADGSRPNDLHGGMSRIAKSLTPTEIQQLTDYFTSP
ncbi:MAG: c-type cytochrome [Methyloglobulus sp.]|nr:c-type cytochrome [Methyloglobulus sp.]